MFKVGDKVIYVGRSCGAFTTGDVVTVLAVLHPSFTNEYLVIKEAPQAGPFSMTHFVRANGLTVAISRLHDPRKATKILAKQMRAAMHKSLKSK